ncbi:MAG: hypothetical protein ACO1SV_25995 [Fimbriimonas sp.]
MNPEIRFYSRRREGGQTIIVAMIILGLLLIIGFVFIGIINRNIKSSARLQDRSLANDLSEAGIRYAHAQLLRSELGADWRGTPTPPEQNPPNSGVSLDPDAFYLRPAGYLADGTTRVRFLPGANTPFDLGGPDGLGPFIRVQFSNGRALVRVRYAQTDANLFRAQPLGPLRNPGLARNYIIIESVGREGRINTNDPTTLTSRTERRVQFYNDATQFQTELNAFREAESRFGGIQINRAFASIGIIEQARFITNKFRTSRPAELGVPGDLGARYRGAEIAGQLPYRLGSTFPVLTMATNTTPSIPTANFPGGGSLRVNGDLKIFGGLEINLNKALGDAVLVSGRITTDEDKIMRLNVADVNPNTGNWEAAPFNLNQTQYSSGSPLFQTGGGILRDGEAGLDVNNAPRGIGTNTPPSILLRDPQTNATRYVEMSRDTGAQAGNGNGGKYGHGRNVYVDNGSRRQTPLNAGAGAVAGGETSLVNEWLSPGGNPGTTGWRGWLYTPPGAYMELLSDGFTIQRDGTGPEATWRLPNGNLPATDINRPQNLIRYRLGRGTDGRLHIVNTLTFPNSNQIHTNLNAAAFSQGPVFGGVVYFEGNVRVRGVIPTDIQLSIVSNATIYIEGSITKGVVGNQYTATYNMDPIYPDIPTVPTAVGAKLTRLSRSMLMLMAKDYVALNPTQFFGASRNQVVEPKEDTTTVGSYNPIVMRAGDPEGLHMVADFVLNPLGTPTTPVNPNDPSTWRATPFDYVDPNNPSNELTTNLLLAHTMDNGAAPGSFFTLDINSAFGGSTYLFPGTDTTGVIPFTNLVSEFVAGPFVEAYGLGTENFERYTQFESIAFPLVNPAVAAPDATRDSFTANSPFGNYRMTSTGINDLHYRPTSIGGSAINDYLMGRAAITPHDVRIEASIYAEEGSFFVIPGAWFNPNPNDTYERWSQPVDPAFTAADRNLRRYQDFGAYPVMPFYGEPLDVRIQIIGAVSENMPVPMSVQAEWMRKWGWIPREHGSSGVSIPQAHTLGTDLSVQNFVPNLTITYDPVLATGRQNGFATTSNADDPVSPALRMDDFGRPLPPLPRLPVSPTLAYFGEVR